MTDAYISSFNEDEQLIKECEKLLGIDEREIFQLIHKLTGEAGNSDLKRGIPSGGERIEIVFGDKAAAELEDAYLKLNISPERLCRIIVCLMQSYKDKRYEKVGDDLFEIAHKK